MTTIRTCRSCGCTDTQACRGGCHWVREDECSACAQKHATIDRIKRHARRIKKEQDIQHSKALDAASQRAGFTNYAHARRAIDARAHG